MNSLSSLNKLPCGVVITDSSLRVRFINNWLRIKLGLDQHALPDNLQHLLPPAGRVFCQTYMLPIMLKEGVINEMFINLKAQDSSNIPAFIYANTSRYDGEECFQWVITSASLRAEFEQELLHQRRQAENFAIQAEQARAVLQSVLDGVKDVAIIAVSGKGDILFANKGADVMFKQPCGALVGCNLLNIVQLPNTTAVSHESSKLDPRLAVELTDYETKLCMYQIPQLPVEIQLRHLKTDPQDGEISCIAVITDIAQRKYYQSLQDNFIANVSHELRTPLTAIFGALTLLKMDKKHGLNPRSQMLIDATLKNTVRLKGLVNDILDFTNLRTDTLEVNIKPTDLCTLIRQAETEQQQNIVHKKIRVTAELPNKPILIATDEERFLQVMANLLSNALKFSAKDDEVKVDIKVLDDEVCIRVIDHGVGVSSDFEPYLFTAFRQQDGSSTRPFDGTGLGLYICKQLVEKMGGMMGFERPRGQGAIFWFTCPRVADAKSRH